MDFLLFIHALSLLFYFIKYVRTPVKGIFGARAFIYKRFNVVVIRQDCIL